MHGTDDRRRPPPRRATGRSTGSEPVSSEPSGTICVPSADPSDPDGEMYAAARARPDWTQKPAARAALLDLCDGLATGQDPFFWDVSKPREARPSDAVEHAILVLPTMRSVDPHGAPPPAVSAIDATLVSRPAVQPPRALKPRRASRPRSWHLVATAIGALVIGAGLAQLARTQSAPTTGTPRATEGTTTASSLRADAPPIGITASAPACAGAAFPSESLDAGARLPLPPATSPGGSRGASVQTRPGPAARPAF